VKLKKVAEDLQDEIEGLEEITRADIVGALDREIQINVDLYKMQAAELSFSPLRISLFPGDRSIPMVYGETSEWSVNLRISTRSKIYN